MREISQDKFRIRLILILTSLSIGVMSFFIPIYSKNLNMSALEIGGLFSISSFILMILRPIIGKLVDKLGRKPILIVAILIYSLSYLAFSVATTSSILYIAISIHAIGNALMSISIYAIVADTHDLANISMGFGKVNSAKATGNIYGCILAFFILSYFPFLKGWKIIFIIFALSSLFALFKAITTFKESNAVLVNKKFSIKNYSTNTIKFLSIVFVSYLFSSMIAPIFMIYLQDKFTTNITYLALTFFPALIIDSLLSEKIGKVSDRLGKNKSMMVGLIVCGITIILIPSLKSITIFILIWTISSIGELLYNLSERGLYTQLNTENNNGEIFGIYTLICDLGKFIGPLIGGFLYDNVSQVFPFYLNGVCLIILAVIIPVLIKENLNLNK